MRKPDKNRFLNAVRHIEAEEIPFQENDPDILLVNRMLGKDFSLSLHAYELPIDDYVELARVMGNDMICFGDIWRLGRKEMTDAEGRIHYVDGTIKTPAALKDIWFPDLDNTRRRLEQTLNAIDGTGLGLMCSNKCAPTVVNIAVGMADYWMDTLESPEFIHEFQKIIHEHSMNELEIFSEHKVDIINLGIIVGMKSGPLCSPESLEEFQYPMLREQIKAAQEKGIVVRLHVDGNATSMIPDFIDMGVDLLHPLEPCDGQQDIFEIKRRYGDQIALHGNIDVGGVLAYGTPDEVRRDTIDHAAKLAAGGGYVVGSSHDLHSAIPLENFYAMRDAVHSYRFKGS